VRAHRRTISFLLITAGVVVALDQATKAIVVARLDDGRSIRAIDGVLHWTLQRNPGSAFGLFQHIPILFTILAAAIAAGILIAAPRVRHRAVSFAMGLVLGGAIGNLVDRIARSPGVFRGHVVDFIDFRVWPVFNIADSAVVIGAIVLAIVSWRSDRETKRDERAPA